MFLVAGALFLACSFPGCGAPKTAKPAEPKAKGPLAGSAPGVRFFEDDTVQGLSFSLRDAEVPFSPAEAIPAPEARALDPARTRTLLARLPDLEGKDGDARAFSLRPGSTPPPRTGKTVEVPFPPVGITPQPEPGTPGELEVLRFAPEGEVDLAPRLNVTFSRPMVAVTSQEEAARTVPARLAPEPPGSWRWLGTRTLVFQPDERFPMATDYAVRIPADTRSATGDTLGKEVAFEFSTPAPLIVDRHPTGGPHDLEPVIYVAFDQRIDRDAMAAHVGLRIDGKRVAARLATAEEIERDQEVRRLVERAGERRFIALVPKRPLPRDTEVTVTVARGAPSAEGPKVTPADQSFTFRTYPPLELIGHQCGWRDECPPDADWRIEFNNPLDEELFDPDTIQVEPAVSGLAIEQWGSNIRLAGGKQGRTRYTVTVPAALTDRFGQKLERDERVTFDVGPVERTLFGPGKTLVTLDPAGQPVLPVHTINHGKLRVRIHQVKPEHWVEFNEWMQRYRYDDAKPRPLPGRKVLDKRLKIAGEPDRLVATPIDLAPHLAKGRGQLLVWIEPDPQPAEQWNRQELILWVQVTGIGVSAFVDGEELLAWTTRLGDGATLPGAGVTLLPGSQAKGRTDDAGLARLPLANDSAQARLLVAAKDGDTAILPADSGWWHGGGWQRVPRQEELRWFTFDDRGMYRPGEKVRVKGWVRRTDPGKGGDVNAPAVADGRIEWSLRGPRGNDLLAGQARLSSLAGFDIDLTLPSEVNLGTASLEIRAPGASGLAGTTHSHPIRIQEFRRPEFQVKAAGDPGPWILGQEASVTVSASYYAGGGLAAAPVVWTAVATPSSYSPPGHADFQFGSWSPWWRSASEGAGGQVQRFEGVTDTLGDHHLGIHFEAMNPARPYNVRAEASVADVNRQSWSASRELLVHPAELYAGLRSDTGFYESGDTVEVEAIAVDIDGAVRPGVELALEAVRLSSRWKRGKWTEEELDPETCRVESGDDPVPCTFHPRTGGSYRVVAVLRDGLGRQNRTELRFWVAGGESPPARDVEQEQVTLVPERQEYQPGDTARFLVQAPFHPAEGLLTVRRSGLVRFERFRLDGPTATLEVPILEEHIPGITVQVDLAGSAPRTGDKGEPLDDLPRRVAFARGALDFRVPPLGRTLSVAVAPGAEVLDPGGRTTIGLTVTDAAGRPVRGAEIALWAADEAVLALTGYRLPDPLAVYYAARDAGVRDHHNRDQVLLSDPSALTAQGGGGGERMMAQQAFDGKGLGNAPQMPLAMPAPAPGAAMPRKPMAKMAESGAEPEEAMAMDMEADNAPAAGDETGAAIALRKDFSALALFAPEVKTDDKGRAAVELKLPDSLTRYRVLAVAVHGGRSFGAGEGSVTARLPLMVRPSPPRFLNFGDRFEFPVIVQNQTGEPMTVEIAVRATNAALADRLADATAESDATGPATAGRKVQVPANDRVEVRFPAAARQAGTARFQVAASSGASADAATVELPVWTPATTEAFATYGEIDRGAIVQPVRAPGDVWPQFGGLEITTSSTQLQALTDAVLYLARYPFDCNEQIASRVLAVAALRDVLAAFEAEGLPSPAELEAAVKADLERLATRQNPDGGFSFWRRGDQSWPYLTIHVAHALARARAKGYAVPDRMWSRAASYLKQIERHIPAWYSIESRRAIRAYALYARHHMGDPDGAGAAALLAEAGLDGLSLEALGWILPALHAEQRAEQVKKVLRHLGNRVTETAAGAHFATSYSDGAHVLLHSDRRADGVILEALIQVDPKSDLIPKVVRGLLGHRQAGKWGNTQENAFVLVALDRYFHEYEKVTPDFVARVWLGEDFAGEHAFEGRTTERARIEIPMSWLEGRGQQPLTVAKDGKGRLYYRIGMRYAPRDLKLAPADYGFAVERVYEHVDDPADVRRDADGTWRFEAGARVRVRVTMAVPTRRYHVALVDPLPAGLEPVNPELAVSGTVPDDPSAQPSGAGRYWWWFRPWYEHQNMRDERVEAFSSLVWEGVHEYTYVARATTPGEFVAPPARAEEMYHPETFGRSGTDRVIVE
jgi:uncharacterized protein YfaS (alpha-2-macroglobulin family)